MYMYFILEVIIFNEHDLTLTFAMLSPVRLSSVCRLCVCNARAPYSGGCNFPQYFYGIYAIIDIRWKFHEDRPRGTPPLGELNTRGVANYSDFGPIDGYISETMQDRR